MAMKIFVGAFAKHRKVLFIGPLWHPKLVRGIKSFLSCEINNHELFSFLYRLIEE
jgi:hypothetical protein